ncbi:hypothetical protein FOL47_000843, partial [Perkinsus chesapeaki]
ELEDSRTFADYNVLKRSSLDMLLRVIGMIRITIQDMTGSTISIDCEPTDTLQKVRGKVQCRTGLPMEQVEVLYGDKALDGDGPLSEFVKARIDVSAQLRLKGYIKIFVETETTQGFVYHMLASATVADLKGRLDRESGVPPKYQKLTHCGVEMLDERGIDYYFGHGGSDHYAVFLSHGDVVKVEVDGGASGRAILYAENSETVATLKDRLELEKERYKDSRSLYHDGEEMKDDKLLRDYNASREFILQLTMKLRTMKVKIQDRAAGKVYTVVVPETGTLWDVKGAARKLGFSASIFSDNKAWFGGVALSETDRLANQGVVDGSTLIWK